MGIGNLLAKPDGEPFRNSLPLMGIGNQRLRQRRRGRVDRLITPHGDRELATPPRGARRRCAPHYPSWGSGTPGLARWCYWPVCSLPLMGIGNRLRRAAHRLRHQLITPHGDRELALEPHRRPLSFDSLPLMGIGNDGDVRFTHALYDLSLPLMGIGNPPKLIRVGRVWLFLITPHGDRERPAPRDRLEPLHLITPHGDREPVLGSLENPPLSASLPLMGIGNRSRTHPRMVRPAPLITPHGDREPRQRGPCACWSRTHYPSWGSGTGVHGQSTRCAQAHYPSWGSGTRAPRREHPRREPLLITPHGDREPVVMPTTPPRLVASLPLMGIGNHGALPRGTWREASHYPSWGSGTRRKSPDCWRTFRSLPLMGIGNSCGGARSRRRPFLITPHGDREHGDEVARWMIANVSLPLMGIGNAATIGAATTAATCSLPLMGIGNPATRAPNAVSLTTHYPSWGSGTGGDPTGAPQVPPGLITPHGDREPVRGARSGAGFPAHYPSWGSGTHTSGRRDRRRCGLITPHGDREHAPFLERRGEVVDSLPLMGIGNRPRVPCPHCGADLSLPLMGIGNPWCLA